MTKVKSSSTNAYRNNLKNREFDKEASQNSHLERATIVRATVASEDENFEKTPTPSKTDSSAGFGKQQSEEDIVEIENKLMPRMRFMAYLFFVMAAASFVFACFAHSDEHQKMSSLHQEQNRLLLDIEAILNRYGGGPLFSDMESLEISPEDALNFYLVSLVFISIGISLFYFSSNKRIKYD